MKTSFPPRWRASRLLVASIAAGAVIATATFLLQLMLDRTAWTLGGAATPFRVFVLSHTLAREAIAVVPIALAGCLLLSDGGGVAGRRSWLRPSLGWALGLVTCFVWTASWALFVSTGQFLDGISFRMGLTNPIQMTLHAVELAPAGLVVVPVATVLIWEACRRAVRVAVAWRGRRQAVVTVAGAVSLVYLTLLGEVGGWLYSADDTHVTHPEGGIGTTRGGLFRQVRADHSGPVAHLLSGVGSAAGDHDLQPGPEEEHVEWRRRTAVSVSRLERPLNVIVLVVESLRSDELAAYGSRLAVMPNADALADESAVLFNHYATATHSNYSSVVPISSQYPLWDPLLHVFPEDPAYPPVRLYDVLKPLGYRTAVISSQNELWGGMANFLESPSLDFFLHAETFEGPKYVPSDDVGFLDYVRVFGRSGRDLTVLRDLTADPMELSDAA